MAFEMQDQAAATLLSQLYMVDAEAALDLYLPREAEQAYKNILQDDPLNPYALQSYAYLLFRWGRLKMVSTCSNSIWMPKRMRPML